MSPGILFSRKTSPNRGELGSHFFQSLPLLTDDDTFLRITFNVYHSIDMYLLFFFLKLLYNDLYRIGYLLVIVQQYLFADNFVYKETGRFVCPLVLIKIRRRIPAIISFLIPAVQLLVSID